ILINNISYFLSPQTVAEREEWYHALLTLKYPHLECLNLHPLHKWTRIKKSSIAKDSFCVFCDKVIMSKSLSFVVCDTVNGLTWDACQTPILQQTFINGSKNPKVVANVFVVATLHIMNLHFLNVFGVQKTYFDIFYAKKHINCVPATSACMVQDVSELVLSPSLVKLSEIEDNFWPLFVFVNIRGGKCQGIQFVRALRGLLNPIQVWDIPAYSIESGLMAIKNIPRFRLLICGGDGTIGWVMSEIDKKIKIAVIPLGTGNDFSRVFGWGASFDDTSKLAARLKWMFHSVTIPFDRCNKIRWEVSIRRLSVGNTEDNKVDGPKDLFYSKFKNSFIYEQTNILIRTGYALIKAAENATISDFIDFVKFECHLKELEHLISIYSRELQFQDYSKLKKERKIFVSSSTSENGGHKPSTNGSMISNIPFKLSSSNDFIDKTIWFESDMKNYKHSFIKYSLERIKISIQKIVETVQFRQSKINKLLIAEYNPNQKLMGGDIFSFNQKNTLISKRYLAEDNLKPTMLYDSIQNESAYSVTMNNYFGVGLDAKIALDFHNMREMAPKNFESRALNKMYYGYLGGKEFMANSCKNLQTHILLECDGIAIKLPRIQAVVVLNIPSYMSGVDFWGSCQGGFGPQDYSDGLLEVTVVSGVDQMCVSRFVGGKRENRVAQCQKIRITVLHSVLPIQVDGEARLIGPCVINISHKNTYFIMKKGQKFESYMMVKVNASLVVKFISAPFSIMLQVTEFFISQLESKMKD
ncbi:hypothetical protein MXB_5557, partial [Myxobolus squamalis]